MGLCCTSECFWLLISRLQRIHLALVREVERVRNKLKSSSKKAAGDALAVAQGR